MIDPDKLEELRKAFKEAAEAENKESDAFWESLSYDDKCNAFHAVVKRIVKAEITDRGSYRYALYDVFGFREDMYTRGMNCGYMTLHNSIVDGEDK